MVGLVSAYTSFMNGFVRTTTSDPEEVKSAMMSVPPADWGAGPPEYAAAMLEQYKIYVEMADRVSARRALANTFFLALNSAIFTVFGVFWERQPAGNVWWLIFPVIGLVGQCVAWYWLLRTYRQLNSAKYTVVGAIESKLPISPFWNAEWSALGQGRVPTRYLPLTHVEQWIPFLFGATYVSAFVAAILA